MILAEALIIFCIVCAVMSLAADWLEVYQAKHVAATEELAMELRAFDAIIKAGKKRDQEAA